jgi:hypothetical protein
MSDLATQLAQLIAQDNAILFVGASLRQRPDQPSLLQQIADALATRIHLELSPTLSHSPPSHDLPRIARDFEVLQGRPALILALREELEKLVGQPDPIDQLIADVVLPTSKVITTRFDRVLELALERLQKPYVLIVRDTDVPFFDETKVTLIKMQGDIGQPDSLVLTEDEVEDFISKLPTVSDVVRAFFATKTLIFLGYELNGEQFKRFFRQVTRSLAGFRRRAYAITAQPMDEVEQRYWEGQNVEICVQDPMAFLEALAQAIRAAVPQPLSAPSVPLRAQPPLPPRPYKALESFAETDTAIFAGRTEESQRLVNRVLAHRLTVLYGESGSGKSSLLRAGAAPRLTQQRALLAICTPTPGQPLSELLRQGLMEAGMSIGLHHPDCEDLPETIHRWQQALNGPIVLAIDQFEQFFAVYDGPERQAALAFLNELLRSHTLDLRLLLVLREDFLGRLQTLEGQLPGALDVRFRLERLGREAARAAIEEPARLFGVTWEPALVQTLLDGLYDETVGGIAPPQLQIACDRLYEEVRRRGESQVSLVLFREMGDIQGILGDYLDQTVAHFSPEQQPIARTLLGALVSSSGIKQRLALDDLARAVEMEPKRIVALLDELTRQRLIRRYEVARWGSDTPRWEYELTHEVLIPRIARWLGDDFWAAQKVREIVRQALPEWESHSRLLAPGDLRQVAAQRGHVHFSDVEMEMLYANAVSYDEPSADWQASLSETTRRNILRRLIEHPEAFVRRQAARRLAAFPNDDVAIALARMAVADPDAAARAIAAQAIAEFMGQDDKTSSHAAIASLVSAVGEHSTAEMALQALTAIRDLCPVIQGRLPANLRGLIRRRVWAIRWQRNQAHILAATLQGMQGGFWGLGLGMGIFFGLYNLVNSGVDRVAPRVALGAALYGLSLAGVLGAFTAGSGALAHMALRSLQDRERSLRTWAFTTGISAVLFSLGLVLVGSISAGQPRPLQTWAAGGIIGLGLAGAATAPLPGDLRPKLERSLRLFLTALTGMAAFMLAGWLDLFFHRSLGWLILMGGAGGVGFFLGLNPGLGRKKA